MNKPNKAEVLKRIQKIIEDNYGTKTEFCRAVGVSPQILGNFQNPNSDRGMPKSLMIGISKLGWNIQWLLYGIGNPIANQETEQEEIRNLREEIKLLERLVLLKQKRSLSGTKNSNASIHDSKESKAQ